MKIGIDIRMWSATGIGTYIRHLIRELILLKLEDSVVLFGLVDDKDQIVPLLPANWRFVACTVKWYSFSEQLGMIPMYNRENLDILHVPHFNVPILYTRPFVVTIHDLIHSLPGQQGRTRHSGLMSLVKQTGYELSIWNAIRRARQVMVPSQYVMKRIQERYGQDACPLTVTYEAADPCTILSSDKVIRILSDVGVSKPYFFYIGNAHPHKNLQFLLRCFEQLHHKYPETQLVLAGHDDYFWPTLKKFAVYEHLHQDVVFAGKVADDVRDALFKGALGYIHPSKSEGFGLPLLEAMSCGCPVLSSSASCLPEVGGDAALYFDPDSVDQCTACMEQLLTDHSLRGRLQLLGFKRAHMFSWKETAMQTYQIYKHAIQQS